MERIKAQVPIHPRLQKLIDVIHKTIWATIERYSFGAMREKAEADFWASLTSIKYLPLCIGEDLKSLVKQAQEQRIPEDKILRTIRENSIFTVLLDEPKKDKGFLFLSSIGVVEVPLPRELGELTSEEFEVVRESVKVSISDSRKKGYIIPRRYHCVLYDLEGIRKDLGL